MELLRDIQTQVHRELKLKPPEAGSSPASATSPGGSPPVKHVLNKSDMRVAKMLFNKADTNRNRSLTKEQLGTLMESLYLPMDPTALAELFDRIDDKHRGASLAALYVPAPPRGCGF